ncbi:MAG: GAF domain-containing protein [Chloroflexi bacterium]|nr:GAF domain-containing protein [Chloroflexota bacterium]
MRRCYVRVRGLAGSPSRLLCELVALPGTSGGALGRLRSTPGGDRSLALDLAAATTLVTSFSPVFSAEGIVGSLARLRNVTGADWAEVFLAEPDSQGMALTWHQGRFRSAFFQKVRFRPDEGYPGLILATQQPILTDGLTGDLRFLRSQVKESGFHCYIGVPLQCSWGVVGSVGVAFRSPSADIQRAFDLLSWINTPLGSMVEGYLLRLQDTLRASTDRLWDLASGPGAALKDILGQTVTTCGAQGAALCLLDSKRTRVAQRFIDGLAPQALCPTLKREPRTCPALAQRLGVALYGHRASWAPPCQRNPLGGGPHCYCIPLVGDEEGVGLLQVYYGSQGGLPPTWNLVPLEHLGRSLGHAIQSGRAITERLNRAQVLARGALHSPEVSGQPSQPGAWPEERKSPAIPYLDIRCLGPFELYRQGVRVSPETVQRRKVLTLLKILLTVKNHGSRVPKDTLIDHLWPEDPLRVRTSQFYVLVHELRRLLEPADARGNWVFVRNEGDRYYFNQQGPYRIDVREFEATVHLGQKAEAEGDTVAAITAYEGAVDLYRSDFMEDEPFAEWCQWERERLREAYLEVRQRLAALYGRSGAWERAVKGLRAALRIDPLREEVHRSLVYALWASGRRDEAVRQYQACRELLLRELGVAPLPETEQLLERIRQRPMP